MLVVHVHVKVKSDGIEAFKQVTIANATESLKEPGVARFDIIQHADDPVRFVLVEAYRSPEAAEAHKSTRHYSVWRDAMESLMAEPRFSVKYASVFPTDQDW